MYQLKSNFYPANEPKNGYIGRADVTVGNAIKMNFSVFENENGIQVRSQSYGENSFVVPHSKEAYAALCDVVKKAVESEKHFAFERGDVDPKLSVTGTRVNEQYADGRFSVEIADFCTLNGITTSERNTADGKSFVAVDMPNLRDAEGKAVSVQTKSGDTIYPVQFEGIKAKWTGKDEKEHSKDYGLLVTNLVKDKRKELHHSLDDQVKSADEAKVNEPRAASAPAKDFIEIGE